MKLRSTDRMFDMNHDGKLDIGEEALKYEFMDHYLKSARGESDDDDFENEFDREFDNGFDDDF